MALAKRFTVDPVFAGKTAIIIGGGPSLSLKQIRLIAKARLQPASPFRVFVVNDAVFAAWFADWHHAGDDDWWNLHIQAAHTFPGIKTTLGESVPEPWVNGYLQNTGNEGFDPDPSKCRTGGNSVYQALCIAVHTGVKKIILVGVDMKESATGEKHWFGDHPGVSGKRRVDYQRDMASKFPTLLPALAERGVQVVNASPDSALATFPLVDLEKELLLRV